MELGLLTNNFSIPRKRLISYTRYAIRNSHGSQRGAALVIAGMAAEGITIVDDIKYIERGYEDFHLKLQALGAQIEKVETDRDIQKFKLKVG